MGLQECGQGIPASSPLMLSWIYPHYCELCHRASEEDLCEDCLSRLPRVPLPICLYCGAPVAGEQEDSFRCIECSGRARSFDLARSACALSKSTLFLIHQLKYHRCNYLAPALSRLIDEIWSETPPLAGVHDTEDWGVVPVPMGAKHLFSRGFNQAEELAFGFAKRRGIRLYFPLLRLPSGEESQTRLSAGERWKNALQSYALKQAYALGRRSLPSHIVLIDDVYTTGATVRACARCLKKAPGVRYVAVLTILRAGVRALESMDSDI